MQESHREPKVDEYGERKKTDATCVEDKQIPFFYDPLLHISRTSIYCFLEKYNCLVCPFRFRDRTVATVRVIRQLHIWKETMDHCKLASVNSIEIFFF